MVGYGAHVDDMQVFLILSLSKLGGITRNEDRSLWKSGKEIQN